jgi:hypothetical protein
VHLFIAFPIGPQDRPIRCLHSSICQKPTFFLHNSLIYHPFDSASLHGPRQVLNRHRKRVFLRQKCYPRRRHMVPLVGLGCSLDLSHHLRIPHVSCLQASSLQCRSSQSRLLSYNHTCAHAWKFGSNYYLSAYCLLLFNRIRHSRILRGRAGRNRHSNELSHSLLHLLFEYSFQRLLQFGCFGGLLRRTQRSTLQNFLGSQKLCNFRVIDKSRRNSAC